MTEQKGKLHYAWVILIGCCCLCAGGIALTISIAGVYLGPVSGALGVGIGDLALWLSFSGIFTVLFLPFWGKLLQTKNANVVLSIAAVIFIAAVALMSTYNAVWQFWVSGALIGIGGPPIFIVAPPALINNWFAAKRGLMLGIASAFTGLGMFVWSPLFTFFIQSYTWRTAYLLEALFMAILILPWTLFLFRWKPADKGLELWGADRVEEIAKDTEDAPSVPASKALKTGAFWAVLIGLGLTSLAMGFNSNQPKMAMEFGQTAMFGATMISAGAVGTILSKLVFGWTADRIGAKKTFAIFYVIFFMAFVLWLLSKAPGALMVGAFFLGFNNGIIAVGYPLITRQLFGTKDYTQIYSRLAMANGLIGGFATSIVGYIYDGAQSYVPALYLGVAAVIVAAACIFVAYAKRPQPEMTLESSELAV